MITFFLILFLRLLPFCYSACSANADQNKYEDCHYDNNNISNPFFNGGNNNANISYCSFKHSTNRQFLDGSRQTFVEHTVCLN
jgi:hypothetical protein